MQEPINILIVEDEILIAEDLKEILEEVGYLNVFKARDYQSAIAVLQDKKINLVLLDINLNGTLTGIDLAKYINLHFNIPFIYVTSYADNNTITQVKPTKPSAFLLKPYTKTHLLASIEIALFNFSNNADASDKYSQTNKIEERKFNFVIKNDLVIKSDYRFVKIPLDEILWFESDKNYVSIKTIHKSYTIRYSLKQLLAQLPSDNFVKCYKQFIVNINHVKSFTTNTLVIWGQQIPISRNKQQNVIQKLTR